MACILIENVLNGQRSWQPEGVSYGPEFRLVPGFVEWNCGPMPSAAPPMTKDLIELNETLEKEGIQWGDAIAWATEKAGIKQCPACHARQLILNEAGANGLPLTIKSIKAWVGTFKKLKETF